jgi:hypothetical protein
MPCKGGAAASDFTAVVLDAKMIALPLGFDYKTEPSSQREHI